MPQPPNRARVACRLCNARRVRCDRSDTKSTCSNCETANAVCELIVSRRGKYKRNHPGRHGLQSSSPGRASQYLPPILGDATDVVQAHGSGDRGVRDVSPSLSPLAVRKGPGSAGEKVIYIGDVANYRYVLNEVGDPFKGSEQNRYWIDNLQRNMTDYLGPGTQDVLERIRSDDQSHLRDSGVFQYPETAVRDELVGVFFEYSYLACPIFHRDNFIRLYKSGALSPLLLNAVFFMATLHCPVAVLDSLGYTNRYLAGLAFYRRAKALYDANWESDGIAIVQATILLSHRCDGPMEQKDTWHWLGVAAGLAQSLGMHRTKSYSLLPSSDRILWRRIWWILYTHDIQYAAVYGRSPHINPDFCDVSLLDEGDFQDFDPSTFGSSFRPPLSEGIIYHRLNTQLSIRAAACITAKYSLDDFESKRRRYNELLEFEEVLPVEFSTLPTQKTLTHGFWPALIHLYHLEYRVVFYRGLAGPSNSTVLVSLAGKVTRILEDMLESGLLYRAPFHIFPAMFSSTVIHIIQIRNSGADPALLSAHRVRLALQMLDGFQDAWPHVIYTRSLLERLFRKSARQASADIPEHTRHGEPIEDPGSTAFDTHRNNASAGSTDTHRELPYREPLLGSENMGHLTPTIPMFSFNNLAEDLGLGVDFWSLDEMSDIT